MVVEVPVVDLVELLLPLESQLYQELANSHKGGVNSYGVCKDVRYQVSELDRLGCHWRDIEQQHEPNVNGALLSQRCGKVSNKSSIIRLRDSLTGFPGRSLLGVCISNFISILHVSFPLLGIRGCSTVASNVISCSLTMYEAFQVKSN